MSKYDRRAVWILVVLGLFLLCGIEYYVIEHYIFVDTDSAPQAQAQLPTVTWFGAPVIPASLGQPQKSTALVPGGIATIEDMHAHVNADAVLQRVFSDFNWSAASCSYFPEDFVTFVSFRRGNRVLWSKGPILIKRGTSFCTDGHMTFLMRCGNLISMQPAPDTDSEDIPEPLLNEPPVLIPVDPILTAENFTPGAPDAPPASGVVTAFAPLTGFPGGGSVNPAKAGEPPVVVCIAIGLILGAVATRIEKQYKARKICKDNASLNG